MNSSHDQSYSNFQDMEKGLLSTFSSLYIILTSCKQSNDVLVTKYWKRTHQKNDEAKFGSIT